MKILVVGGGGREHAIVKKLKESKAVTELFCAPGNGGIAKEARCVPIPATDLQALTDFAVKESMDYVVVAPDDPLCLGLVDRLQEKGIPAFGPSQAAARIEGSKVFAKGLMKKYGIPTAAYESFDSFREACAYLDGLPEGPRVVKADGLALGKGVVLCGSKAQAKEAVRQMMEENRFGAAGARVVLEEMLQGPEVSVLCFADGKTLRPMVSSMDHKRALDGDRGPNTGGMGVVAPNPYYTPEMAKLCMDTIFQPTLEAMQKEGCPFCGCLYFGLMLTKSGPKVIEYNCRFGDPEAQAVLPLLQSDLLTLMLATTRGTLSEVDCVFQEGCSCCVVLASGGYPEQYESGKWLRGIQEAEKKALVYQAGTRLTPEKHLVTAGGRVLGVVATADMLPIAIERAYAAARQIDFEGMHMRLDIGAAALQALEKQL